jgi:hypothetical protein
VLLDGGRNAAGDPPNPADPTPDPRVDPPPNRAALEPVGWGWRNGTGVDGRDAKNEAELEDVCECDGTYQ